MDIESARPPAELRHLLREFYFCTLEAGSQNHPRPVIDDCCYDFIFYREGKAVLQHGPEARKLPIPYRFFTLHGLNPPYRFQFNGTLTFFTIKVQPWANALFFGELEAPGIHNLDRRFPQWSREHTRLFEAHTTSERFAIAAQMFHGATPELPVEARWVREICDTVYRKQGKVSVAELSEQFAVSRQHLNKQFRKQVRYSLKHFILSVRMIELIKYRMEASGVSLTELAHAFDYFDQSHFIRDFRKFSGMTPSDFFGAPPEFMKRH